MSTTNQSTEEQWAQDASDVLTQEQVDAIDASEACVVDPDAKTRNQVILEEYLEDLCVDNGVPVFQQWMMWNTREKGEYSDPNLDESNCRCSHWIHNKYTIVNVFNGNIGHPIGSDCIQRWFSGNDILEQLAVLKKDKMMSKESRYPCQVAGCRRYSEDGGCDYVCAGCWPRVKSASERKVPFGINKKRGYTWAEVYSKNRGWVDWAMEKDFMKEQWHKYSGAYLRAMMKAEPTIKLS